MEPARLNALRVATFFINWQTGWDVGDTQSGFRVYPRAALERVVPRRGGFVLETEMLVRAAAAGFAIRGGAALARPGRVEAEPLPSMRDGTAVTAYLTFRGHRALGAGCCRRS
jgi:hypothetical protein